MAGNYQDRPNDKVKVVPPRELEPDWLSRVPLGDTDETELSGGYIALLRQKALEAQQRSA